MRRLRRWPTFEGDELFERTFGKPVDRAYWAANNPATIARDNAGAIRDSGLHVLIEAGDEDVFLLHEGTDFLHRVLYDEGIRHEYHYYKWVDHGSDHQMRMRTILRFLGRALDPPTQGARVTAMRDRILPLREAVGVPSERYVPPPAALE
jgi:S-formylglutathione hydrolase